MEKLYAQALDVIDTFAQKHHIKGLCEFEYKLYEKLCDSMAIYFGGMEYAFMISSMKTQQEYVKEAREHAKWAEEEEKQRVQDEKKEPPEE